MGYGGLPNFTEYDSSGNVLLDAHARPSVQDFRTYLAPWSGAAGDEARRSPPRHAGSGTVTVEASWNGATDGRLVEGARRRVGDRRSSAVATAPQHGFETTITVHTSAPLSRGRRARARQARRWPPRARDRVAGG